MLNPCRLVRVVAVTDAGRAGALHASPPGLALNQHIGTTLALSRPPTP